MDWIPPGVLWRLFAIPELFKENHQMCSPMPCRACGKTTWGGCGMHADMVMSRIPEEQRCDCHSAPAQSNSVFTLPFAR